MFKQWPLLLVIFVTSNMLAQQTHVVTNLNNLGTGSLRQIITGSSNGDIITFSPSLLANGSATIFLNSAISFNHGLTIRGLFSGNDSLFISGNDSSSIFYIDARTFALPVRVHLENLVLQNAQKNATSAAEANNGGALFAAGLERLSLKNVVMRHNTLSGPADGGAMFLNEIDTAELSNCIFYNNHTDTSGNVLSRGGVARALFCNVSIDNCVFKRNASDFLGGAFSSLIGSLYINHSSWKGNIVGRANRQAVSSQRGGAISAYVDSLYVSDSNFSNNIARSGGGSGGEGGAIYVNGSNSIIKKSTFLQNKAINGDGGAIRSYTNSTDTTNQLRISKCTIEANDAGQGGAIEFLNNDALVNGCLLKDNNATQGGAIYGYLGSLILRNTTLLDNDASSEGSDCYLEANMTCTISKSSLLNTSSASSIFFQFPFSWQVATTGQIYSSIVVNGGVDIHNSTADITSNGYNIFSGNPSFVVASDTSGLTQTALQLQPLGDYGGLTESMPPMLGSPAFNTGNPLDFTPAQNGPVFGRRDCGAAEASIGSSDTVELCGSYQWRGMTFNSPGLYADTVFNSNSIDSIAYLTLEKPDSIVGIINGVMLAPPRNGMTAYQWIACDTAFTEISGATDSIFQPSVNGSYAVVMTSSACIDTSDCMSYNQVDIEEHRLEAAFVSFYPNPSEGNIHLEVNEHIKLSALRVYDLQGRSIDTYSISEHTINLGDLPPGVFILEWRSTEGHIQRDQLIIK